MTMKEFEQAVENKVMGSEFEEFNELDVLSYINRKTAETKKLEKELSECKGKIERLKELCDEFERRKGGVNNG